MSDQHVNGQHVNVVPLRHRGKTSYHVMIEEQRFGVEKLRGGLNIIQKCENFDFRYTMSEWLKMHITLGEFVLRSRIRCDEFVQENSMPITILGRDIAWIESAIAVKELYSALWKEVRQVEADAAYVSSHENVTRLAQRLRDGEICLGTPEWSQASRDMIAGAISKSCEELGVDSPASPKHRRKFKEFLEEKMSRRQFDFEVSDWIKVRKNHQEHFMTLRAADSASPGLTLEAMRRYKRMSEAYVACQFLSHTVIKQLRDHGDVNYIGDPSVVANTVDSVVIDQWKELSHHMTRVLREAKGSNIGPRDGGASREVERSDLMFATSFEEVSLEDQIRALMWLFTQRVIAKIAEEDGLPPPHWAMEVKEWKTYAS